MNSRTSEQSGGPKKATIRIRRTDDTYDLELSGKLGSRLDLEREYVQRLSVGADEVVSLRDALDAYKASSRSDADWKSVVAAQERLEGVKDKLLAAGYTLPDLTKLALDNT